MKQRLEIEVEYDEQEIDPPGQWLVAWINEMLVREQYEDTKVTKVASGPVHN